MCCGSHVKVYSYSSRRIVYTLAHHTKEVTGVALHPKNRMQVLLVSYPDLIPVASLVSFTYYRQWTLYNMVTL